MTRRYCSTCNKWEWAQAVEVEPRRPMEWLDWSLAIVVGGYLLMLAWVLHV